ncbi:hypothetical protein NQ318_008075 [Aromia moschata]|uniref:Uncharacterized protein n=1 Tax=Aromia moschata TaxID=1265417 RepID=A0AAV8YMP1_9CUCU|nr:hypothetical protein NQ318_008075 [Aromia moschata]
MVNTRSTRYDEETTIMDEKKGDDKKTKSDDRRTNDDDRRIVKRQKAERRSDDRRTNDDDRRTVKRQKGERKSGDRRTNDDDRGPRRGGEASSGNLRVPTSIKHQVERIDGVEQQIDQVGKKVNQIEKVVEENKEEIERKLEKELEYTKRQVHKEILERIEGLGHQLHGTSITDLEHSSTSPGTPLHSSLRHAERSVHKILKPPTYDGESSWSMYRRQFEAAAKANGWTSQEMATSLVISLRVYQSQIKSRQQRSNESLQEYEADIERLVHLAYPQAPKEFLEQIGIQTFIDGLVDIEMQQALRLGRHTTISDAIVAALEFKAAKEASRSHKSRVRQVKFDECQSLQETIEKIMRNLNQTVELTTKGNQALLQLWKNWAPTGLLQGQIKVSVKNEHTRPTARSKIKIQESRHKEVERRKWDIEDFTAQDWSFPYPRPKTSFQIASKRFGKRQLVDARGRVSTTIYILNAPRFMFQK